MNKSRYTLWLTAFLIFVSIEVVIVFVILTDESSNRQVTVKYEDSNKSIQSFNVLQLTMSEWNTPEGIPYKQVPGANLGVTAFHIMDQNRIAFLCNSSNEIIITDLSSGKAIDKFQVSFAPRDMVYENNKFYVLSEYEVTVYDNAGNELVKYPFPMTYQGVERFIRFNDATYLLLPEGNSLMIEDCGESVEPVVFKGIITEEGCLITLQITGNNSYSIKILFSNNKTAEKVYTTDKKTAGVFIVGATKDRVFLDVQTFISENPIAVERIITAIELNNNELMGIVTETIVPQSYYVISNKDFYVSKNGNIYNMMTSPQGVSVFSLTEAKSEKAQGYPSTLTDNQYNSNDNLIKID